ncbi:MAG: class I SAM-dependent methyltransferase, partial [Pseudomonadota bacterium]|nr:class I SAM-dependent methyltransferase [Pseudomonadota bacterium]
PKMDHWRYLPHGRYLLDAERKMLQSLLPRYFGYHLLQIGGPEHFDLLESSLINHHVRLTDEYAPGFNGTSVQSDLEELPFLPNSIDLVLLPHTLDRLQNAPALLKAVYDVLIPEGHVIILGYNAMSLWRLAKLWRRDDVLLQRAQFHGAWQVRHWLTNAGFQIDYHKSVAHRPPFANEALLQKCLFLDPMGQLLWPNLGAVHVIVARKQVVSLTAIRPNMKTQPIALGDPLAKPSAMNEGDAFHVEPFTLS